MGWNIWFTTLKPMKIKIRFMNLSKDELRKNMKRYKGIARDQSPMFKSCMKLNMDS